MLRLLLRSHLLSGRRSNYRMMVRSDLTGVLLLLLLLLQHLMVLSGSGGCCDGGCCSRGRRMCQLIDRSLRSDRVLHHRMLLALRHRDPLSWCHMLLLLLECRMLLSR